MASCGLLSCIARKTRTPTTGAHKLEAQARCTRLGGYFFVLLFLSTRRMKVNWISPEDQQPRRLRYISGHGKGVRLRQTHCSHRPDRPGALGSFETPQRPRYQGALPDRRRPRNRRNHRLRRLRRLQPLSLPMRGGSRWSFHFGCVLARRTAHRCCPVRRRRTGTVHFPAHPARPRTRLETGGVAKAHPKWQSRKKQEK